MTASVAKKSCKGCCWNNPSYRTGIKGHRQASHRVKRKKTERSLDSAMDENCQEKGFPATVRPQPQIPSPARKHILHDGPQSQRLRLTDGGREGSALCEQLLVGSGSWRCLDWGGEDCLGPGGLPGLGGLPGPGGLPGHHEDCFHFRRAVWGQGCPLAQGQRECYREACPGMAGLHREGLSSSSLSTTSGQGESRGGS